MAASSQDASGSTRWWEFYAVRYGMGTVIGGVVFFFLCNTNPVLKHLLFGAQSGKIDGPLLTLLAGYGLAYCYIASAPVLVFHAGRFLFDANTSFKKSLLHVAICVVPPLVTAIVFYCINSTSHGSAHIFFTFVVALAGLVVWPQYVVVCLTLFRTKELFWFYRRLAERRSSSRGELVTSYRHLREHGNSFFIVILEILLAVILYTAGNFHAISHYVPSVNGDLYVLPYVEIVLAWVVPAALVWLVGTLLERQFCDNWP